MQQALEKLEQEIKAVKRAGRLAKGVLEEGLEARSEAKELHAKFSVLFEALGHLSQALDTHYASLEDDVELEQVLINLKRMKSKTATPLASLESANSAKEVLEALASLEQGVLDLEGVLTSLKAHPSLNAPTSPKAPTKGMAKKYCPQSKEELKKLVADESVHLGEIDISQITDLSFVFSHATGGGGGGYAPAFERQNFEGLETWDTSHVTNMRGMFYRAILFNHDISSWNVSRVRDMGLMFCKCGLFNQPLNSWNVSNVELMEYMFRNCTDFNQPLNNWNVSKVKAMTIMFRGCENFNQDLSDWDVSSVQCGLDNMLEGCGALKYKPTWYNGNIPRDFLR
ncbi:BspA family leucine-rich repeat surface protein [Helicobacter ailurogastricus]|uniref:BspA family leucine-rich repeat surface protein n=1 Tax=Helicobacter ailurogastricus TaxID=1578720 RepID=UPI000CF0EE46|nr:BspA family leucine-rich repeat surface protein [Helicobacter ailurogastricus]